MEKAAKILAIMAIRDVLKMGDPRLLARAILGLYNSVWHWYRPNGTVALPRVAEFFVARSLALAGVAPDVAESVLLVA